MRRSPLLLLPFLAAIASILLAPSAASAAVGIPIATDGNLPGIAVDDSGTAHIAFASQTGAAFPYTNDYSYCRLPRGASACNKRTRLLSGGIPNGSLFTFGTAQVLVDGARVIVVGDTCCGPGQGVKAWVSTNSGTSFAPPVKLFDSIDIREAMLGPGSNSISAIDGTTTAGLRFATGDLGGSTGGVTPFSIGAGALPGGANADAYGGVGLLNGQIPYAVLSGDGRVVLRRFDPQKSGFNTPSSWIPGAQLIDGDNARNPVTTYGPSGAFVANETTTPRANLSYPYLVRRISDGGEIGPATEVGGTDVGAQNGDISQDAAGRLHLAYLDNKHDNRLTYQWSKRGVYWSDPASITVDDEDISGMQVGVAPDGGGWIVAGSSNNYTPIKVYPLAPKGDADPGVPVPTPPPGGGGPGAPPADPPLPCPALVQVAAGVKAQVRTADCFKDVSKSLGGKNTPNGTIFRTTGSVRVNGVDFTAPASGTFVVNTKTHTVEAQGNYSTQVGAVVLRKGGLLWDVTKTNPVPDLSAFGVKLFGLRVAGKADVSFDANGAAVTVNLDLPYPLSAIRGSTTLRATMSKGLVVDGVRITADTVPIGPLELRNLDISYTGANDGFEGFAEVVLPPSATAAIKAGFGLEGGAFKHAEFEVNSPLPPLPLPLFATPPIILNQVGFAASVSDAGFKLGGGIKLVVGGEIAGLSPVAIDALPPNGATLTIPRNGSGAKIEASGKITVLDLPIATGSVSIDTAGPIGFKGSTGIDLAIVNVGVSFSGQMNLKTTDFYAEGAGEAGLDLGLFSGKVGVGAILSTRGIAGCGKASLTERVTGATLGFELGAERPWGGSLHIGACNLAAYKPASLGGPSGPPPPAGPASTPVALTGPSTVTLGDGTVRGVRITGAGSKPGFTFSGPNGRSVVVPPNLTQGVTKDKIVAVPVDGNAVEVQVLDPKGTWTITPDATQQQLGAARSASGPVARRSATVASVATAAELPTPTISGSVRRSSGRTRQVTVRASNLGSQRLLIRELGASGASQDIGTVRQGGTTTLRFQPAAGPGGKRTITAVVLSDDGFARRQSTLTSYVAPPPAKLAAPRRVTLARTARAVGVRWTRVADASRYRVVVTANDGRKQILTAPARATKLTIPAVTRDDLVTVSVIAVDRAGNSGAARTATSRGRKLKRPKSSLKR